MALLRLSLQGHDNHDDLPPRAVLRRWLSSALQSDAEITLRFVGGSEGRQLNRRFRGVDRATNVLTFCYRPRPRIHADIVICVPKVWREAQAQRKRPIDHLAHLVVHGALHAQGLDHGSERQAAAMAAREVRILARFGIGNPYVNGSAARAPDRKAPAKRTAKKSASKPATRSFGGTNAPATHIARRNT